MAWISPALESYGFTVTQYGDEWVKVEKDGISRTLRSK